MLKIGDQVTFYSPGSKNEHESWTRGKIVQTLARKSVAAVHRVKLDAFKWDREAPWGFYDGVSECLGLEYDGNPELEWIGSYDR